MAGNVARWSVRVASLLVPAGQRRAWYREWDAELWHRERELTRAGAGPGRLVVRLVGPALGAFVHAGWLRVRNPGFDSVRQDIWFAIRAMTRSPAFTATTVVTLGLGIAANVAVFAVLEGALLDPYPYSNSDRLAAIVGRADVRPGESLLISFPEIEELRRTGVLESVAAFDWDPFNLRLSDRTEWVGGGVVSASAFSMLGIAPIRGRFFRADEDAPGAPDVLVLGERLWRSTFGGREVVGETVWLDGRAFEVIGVAPAKVDMPEGAELWIPLRPTGAAAAQDSHWLQAYGRLAAGVTWEQAGTVLAALGARMASESPASNEGRTFDAVRLRDYRTGEVRNAFFALAAAVGLLLLIVTANLTSLCLARSATRESEFGMRRALGASRGRIARQLVTESLVVSGLASMFGFVAGNWSVLAMARALPEQPVWFNPSFGTSSLVVALVLAVFCGLLFGLAPFFSGRRGNPATSLRSGRSVTNRSNDMLVFTEVALATVLLVASVMLVRSLSGMLAVDPGFEAQNRISGTIQLPAGRYANDEDVIGFAERLMQTLESRPDVESVAAVTRMPFRSGVNRVMWWENGQGEGAFRENPQAELNSVTSGYFDTMGIAVKAGRSFSSVDRAESRDVVIISETFAREYFGDRDPVGAQISFQYPPRYAEVVGVVEDVKHQGLDQDARFQIYAPFTQRPTQRMTVVARGRVQPIALGGAMRDMVRRLDPDLALSDLRLVDDAVRQSVWRLRLLTQVFWVFGIFAIFLVAVGIAGIVAQAVERRTREFGIRMALGARRWQILGLVGRRIGRVLGRGLLAGTVTAFVIGRFARKVLFGVSTGDPLTYAMVVTGFVVIGTAAAWLPARRATAIDPARALRSD